MAEARDGLLTAAGIARELGVTDTKVKKAIKELGLEPAAKKGVCACYGADALAQVKGKLGG